MYLPTGRTTKLTKFINVRISQGWDTNTQIILMNTGLCTLKCQPSVFLCKCPSVCSQSVCVRTHIGGGVGLLSALAECHAAGVAGCGCPGVGGLWLWRLLWPLLHVAHQSLANDVFQTQIAGWVTEGVVPGVHCA